MPDIPFGDDHIHKRPSKFEGPWSPLPAWFVDKGLCALATGKELAVLIVLVRHADNDTHETMITHEKISLKSGISLRSISEATNRLVMYGVIQKNRKGNRMVYRIAYSSPDYMAGSTYWAPNMGPKRRRAFKQDGITGQFT